MGSLVKVTCWNAAVRILGLRLLPLSEASSALAAASAWDLLLAMKLLAWIWPLSSPLTADACWEMKDWVATRLVVTNWPLGHRLASLTSAWPPAASISASEFGVMGVIGTSPPPVGELVRPCFLSQ